MSLFGDSADSECDGGEWDHEHEGSFDRCDEMWKVGFIPRKQDDDYVYGYEEEYPYAVCENCGEKVKLLPKYMEPQRNFTKLAKDDIPESDIEKVEVALDKLPYK